MTRSIAGAFAALVAAAPVAHAQEPKTYFDYVEGAFAVAEVKLATPMEYRDGKLLVTPGQLVDVVYARLGRPQTIMLVYEKRPDADKAPFEAGDRFLAPIRVLPEYSFWRDNLPKTVHHETLGGARYIFRGEQIEEAKRVTRPFAATLARKRGERWPDQGAALVEALFSTIDVLREDAGRELAASPPLLKALRADSRDRLAEFLDGDHPEEERLRIIGGIAAAGAADMAPALEKLAKRDDATGAAALRALESLGTPLKTDAVLRLTGAKSEQVRGFAYESLGARAANDRAAFDAAVRSLSSEEPVSVRAAAARGLGKSGNTEAVAPLAAALGRGDQASQPAASALASIGGKDAAEALKGAISHGTGASESAAVIALADLRGGCADCLAFLHEQHRSHPDESVRDLIGIVLEVPRKHEH